jgi:hypothetical protein
MKVLFVDHSFHQKTKSSSFFLEILERAFDVETLYFDPLEPRLDLSSCKDDIDVVVIWQLDFLAPAFVAIGKRVVVVPMYDGSANMPDLHWIISRQCRFINFSRRLHFEIERCGGNSKLVKYFPAPSAEV